VVAALQEEPQVRQVVRLPGAEVKTGGDVVMAFLQGDASSAILERIQDLRDWEPWQLSLISTDLVPGRQEGAKVEAHETEGTSILWDMILSRARDQAHLSPHYLTFMVCAGLIATLGLVHDLPILIVGAMSLSPDLAPATTIAVDLAMGDLRGSAKALGTLLVGLGVALAIAFALTAGLQAVGLVETGIQAVDEQLTSFVTVVDPVTAIVAITAGVAAMAAFVTEQGLTTVGVAISVTTIPAASYAGVAMASGAADLALDALGVLAVNIVLLVVAEMITLAVIRAWRRRGATQATG
jgi:uncharacterized hydrophobic protein (TIGR00271 family)